MFHTAERTRQHVKVGAPGQCFPSRDLIRILSMDSPRQDPQAGLGVDFNFILAVSSIFGISDFGEPIASFFGFRIDDFDLYSYVIFKT